MQKLMVEQDAQETARKYSASETEQAVPNLSGETRVTLVTVVNAPSAEFRSFRVMTIVLPLILAGLVGYGIREIWREPTLAAALTSIGAMGLLVSMVPYLLCWTRGKTNEDALLTIPDFPSARHDLVWPRKANRQR